MSAEIAIKVINLSKCYRIYERSGDRLKQFIVPRLQRMVGLSPSSYGHEFWALHDVSFEVGKGETVGIIGRNGSGKSTLLQMICGTLYPTAGSVEVNGRIAALLELGAGFNPEFSGRENIYTNGAVLGLSEQQIEDRYDQIVAFADIGEFIEQPVKMYSSGMYVRVAFAIAAHIDPSVLIIDEALAVGDMAFQAKCMTRLRELIAGGTTVLFVSHDLSSVRNICQRVLWLKEGQAMQFGNPKEVVDAFVRDLHLDINTLTGTNTERSDAGAGDDDALAAEPAKRKVAAGALDERLLAATNPEPVPVALFDGFTRYGDGRATISEIALLNEQGQLAEMLELHERFTIKMKIKAHADIAVPVIGYSFRDLKGNQVVAAMSSNFSNAELAPLTAGAEIRVEIGGVNALAQGVFTLTVGLENAVELNKVHQYVDIVENALVFRSTYGGEVRNIFPAMVWQPVQINVIAAI